MQALTVQGGWELLPWTSTPYAEPLLPGSSRTKGRGRRRGTASGSKWWEEMRRFLQKKGRLEVGFWGEGKPGAWK